MKWRRSARLRWFAWQLRLPVSLPPARRRVWKVLGGAREKGRIWPADENWWGGDFLHSVFPNPLTSKTAFPNQVPSRCAEAVTPFGSAGWKCQEGQPRHSWREADQKGKAGTSSFPCRSRSGASSQPRRNPRGWLGPGEYGFTSEPGAPPSPGEKHQVGRLWKNCQEGKVGRIYSVLKA